MNKIILIGNLGKDPDGTYTANGTAVTKFTLAVSRRAKTTEGEAKVETDWFSIITWNKLAEVCNQYLRKGQKVYIEGRLSMRTYTDKLGVERMVVEVIANEMEMLSPKPKAEEDNDEIDALLAELEKQ